MLKYIKYLNIKLYFVLINSILLNVFCIWRSMQFKKKVLFFLFVRNTPKCRPTLLLSHAHTHTRTHARAHTHTHTHTNTRARPRARMQTIPDWLHTALYQIVSTYIVVSSLSFEYAENSS